jgi:phage-related protein
VANARKVVIEFIGQDKSLGRTANQAEGRLSKLGGRLKSVGRLAAVGLGAGLVVGAGALAKMTQGAIEDAAGQAKLAKALKNSTGATKEQVAGVEDWITAQGKALGVADDDLRPALAKLAGATGDIGKAQKLASLAMNVSAGTGKSLEQVSTALTKAQNGQVAGLSKLGISTKDAEGKVISFHEAQKRLAKLHAGQAQAAANTTAGKFARLKLALSETGETIGAKLIPVATKLAEWFLNDGLPALQRFGGYLQDKLPPIFERVRAVISTILGAMKGDVGGNLAGIRQIFKDAVTIIQRLWSLFGANITQYLKATMGNLKKILSGAFDIIRGIFRTVAALLKGDWRGAWDGIKLILRGAVKVVVGIVSQMWNLIRFAFKNAGVAIKGIFGGIWSGIKTLARNGASWLIDTIRGIPGRLAGLAKSFANAGRGLIGAFVNGMKNAGGIISGIAGNVWNAVKGLLDGAIDKINAALEFKISLPGPDVHINPPNIPHLAKGGVVRARQGGTLALLGEAGHDEAVIPLSGPHAPKAAPADSVTENVTVILQVDGKELHRALLRRKRLTGPLGLA